MTKSFTLVCCSFSVNDGLFIEYNKTGEYFYFTFSEMQHQLLKFCVR